MIHVVTRLVHRVIWDESLVSEDEVGEGVPLDDNVRGQAAFDMSRRPSSSYDRRDTTFPQSIIVHYRLDYSLPVVP